MNMVTNNETLKKLHNIQTQCSLLVSSLGIPHLSGLEYTRIMSFIAFARAQILAQARTDHPFNHTYVYTCTYTHTYAYTRAHICTRRTHVLVACTCTRTNRADTRQSVLLNRYGIIRFYVRIN